MSAQTILERLKASGLHIKADGDNLRVGPKESVTPETLDLIRAHKAELLEAVAPVPLVTDKVNSGDPGKPEATVIGVTPESARAALAGIEVPQVLAPNHVELIEAVCNAWEAPPDELATALGAATRDPSLLPCWSASAKKLGLLDPKAEARRQRVLDFLAANPQDLIGIHVEDIGRGFVVVVGAQGCEPCEYFITREKFDGVRLMEMFEKRRTIH